MCKQDNVEYAQVSLGATGHVVGFVGPREALPHTTLDKLAGAGWRFEAVLEQGNGENVPLLLFKRHKPAYTPGGVEIVSVRELLDEPQNRQAAG